MRIRLRRRPDDSGTSGLPPAGADFALYGTAVEMPYLERTARERALRTQRRTAASARRRRFRHRLASGLRRAVRPGIVLVLDVAGVCGLVWTAWLIWEPLAWGLASVVALALGALLDTSPDDTGGGE